MTYDVIAFGSTMLRLSVPAGERLEHADSFKVGSAGSESNSMAALAALGFKTAWVSRLSRNFIGKRIEQDIRSLGVDTSHIIWAEEGRNEVFFVEDGAAPRPGQVVYDRRDSALSMILGAELDVDFMLSGRFLHLTGITPSLSPQCAAVCAALKKMAMDRGVGVSFDVNYRSKLWSPAEAETVLTPLLDGVDVLLLTREDAATIWNIHGDAEAVARECRGRFNAVLCVLTLGADGAVAFDGVTVYRTGGYQVRQIDRLGAGDAFTAGVLAGVLEGSVEQGLNYGAAMAAIKMGIAGDYFRSDRGEVLRVIGGQGGDVRR